MKEKGNLARRSNKHVIRFSEEKMIKRMEEKSHLKIMRNFQNQQKISSNEFKMPYKPHVVATPRREVQKMYLINSAPAHNKKS